MASLLSIPFTTFSQTILTTCSQSPTSTTPSTFLLSLIDKSFSSFPSLRSTFLATANALFGPGFVWLVYLNDPSTSSSPLAILTTYIAGSPYPQAHFRLQPLDMATTSTNIISGMHPQDYASKMARGTAGMVGPSSKGDKKLAPGGQDLEVLLGVNTWEHVWLRDYGIGGKRQYLEAWWDRVDWGRAEEMISNRNPTMGRPMRSR